jgi:hypothetical protein
MVFIRDDSSVFDAPLNAVWEFLGRPDEHTVAHRHRDVKRVRLSESSGQYSWEQEFDGRPERFTMRWHSYHPVGIAYDVLEGPFTGSRFFLYYVPQGQRTGVSVVGEFVSPTLSEPDLVAAVDRFFSLEFEQDHAAIRHHVQPP